MTVAGSTNADACKSAASTPVLRDGLRRGGAPRMWERIVRESLPAIRTAVPPGSRVLEIGYGDGLLSCCLAAESGWSLVGLDTSLAAAAASAAAERYGLEKRLDFRGCRPEETRLHHGAYDAVFAKTVLYASESLSEYGTWLDWILSVLRPGGVLISYETGRANELMQIYRRLRRRAYTGLCLYTSKVEALYDRRFELLFRKHYGGLSQFLSPAPMLYEAAAALEERLARRSADNCFAVAIVARKPASAS